tara:strand:+ start:138 stop:371 length:234 start_codon:yes stop_codon:yes gene_type:complete
MYKILIILLVVTILACLSQKNKIESFEGNKKMKDQIDLLTYSKFSPSCCPSTYSTSTGCLCDNFNEFDIITSRGGNR